MIYCPKCNKPQNIVEAKMVIVEQEALLVCPVCKSEYSLQAVLKQVGAGAEEEPFEEPFTEPLPEPETPEPETVTAPEPEEPEMKLAEPGEEEERVKSVSVQFCNECKTKWVTTFVKECPRCKSDKVIMTSESVESRVKSAVEEVDNGVPASRAVDRMLGVAPITDAKKKELSVPEKHQRKIAISTLKMSDVGANVMGGMTKKEARDFLKSIGEDPEKYEEDEE